MADKERVSETVYFSAPGVKNAERTVTLAVQRARELKIKELVVATGSGRTALQAAELFPEGKVIAVTYHSGTDKPFDDPLPPAARKKLAARGVAFVTCGHALSGCERGLGKGGWTPLDLVANTLRVFGQGTKVCFEIVLMAADAGALSGNEVVAVGGSAEGADTALVITPAHQANLFGLKVREVICKPR
jgi:hypothetical protein